MLRFTGVAAAASVALFGSLVAPLSAAAAGAALPPFASMDTLFSFGDSYSTVGYKPDQGLTPLPGLGGTTSGGYNWVQFLAKGQNQSYFDFAQSAATVNNSIIHIDRGTLPPSFDMQLAQFEQFFGGSEPEIPWTADKSLFTVFFGINDIGFTVLQGPHNASEIVPRIVASYEASVTQLYERGARHFLLLLMPPTNRTPYIRSFGAETGAKFIATIELFVSTLTAAIADLSARYPDATFTTYDTAPLFNAILDSAEEYGFTVSSKSCYAYWNKHQPDNDQPSCDAPLSEYVWNDDYHPTWRVHALLAEDITKTLTGDAFALGVGTTPSGEILTRRTTDDAPRPAKRRTFERRRPGHASLRAAGAGARAQAVLRERMRRSWAGLPADS